MQPLVCDFSSCQLLSRCDLLQNTVFQLQKLHVFIHWTSSCQQMVFYGLQQWRKPETRQWVCTRGYYDRWNSHKIMMTGQICQRSSRIQRYLNETAYFWGILTLWPLCFFFLFTRTTVKENVLVHRPESVAYLVAFKSQKSQTQNWIFVYILSGQRVDFWIVGRKKKKEKKKGCCPFLK